MLPKRIIPCLDVKDGRVVKGVNFVNFKDAGDPAQIAAEYSRAGADELVFLDITATVEVRKTMLDMVKKVAKQVTIPFAVGGGIRTADDFKEILDSGADKVSINSAAIKRPELILEAANLFGRDCVVVAIDAKKREGGDGWNVCINGGSVVTDIDVVTWAQKCEKLGAGEILLTSLDCDGTKAGYDNQLNRAVTAAVKIPVIASGGAGKKEDFYDAIVHGGVDAVLAASLFHFKEVEIMELKKYLNEKNIPVRMEIAK
ncbi:MAG: imidazole glycerol phosphate synthase subunit HisF [Eubacteriales bacterium]|nr:imidazole glycerol phosphate synthase subunit HisF [Eubacteriales bacterium]